MGSTQERVPTLQDVQIAIDRGDRREALARTEQMALHGSRSFWGYDYWVQRMIVMIMNNQLGEAVHSLEVATDMPSWEQKFELQPFRTLVQQWINLAARPIQIMEFLDKLEELCQSVLSKDDFVWIEQSRCAAKLNEAHATFFHLLSSIHRHSRATQERLMREAKEHFTNAQTLNSL